mgnify:FL=1|tara:strand:- start:331 stop:657 length:327 start_codon:yes stop_codon:yes gene_type:complete
MEDISLRLKEILRSQSINASEFAKKINVQRSSISHILSGRNKPSLEIVTKICKEFPEIDIEWLIFGTNKQNPYPTLNENNNKSKNNIDSEVEKIILLLKNGTFKEFKN